MPRGRTGTTERKAAEGTGKVVSMPRGRTGTTELNRLIVRKDYVSMPRGRTGTTCGPAIGKSQLLSFNASWADGNDKT